MWFIKREFDWLKEHAHNGHDEWRCRKSNVPIRMITIGRSMWIDGFRCAGMGEVRSIAHLHCPSCTLGYTPPEFGEGIYESEVVEAHAK